MAEWYVNRAGWEAVSAWAALTVYGAGAIVRQLATPAIYVERCFRTTAGGTSGAAEPTWTTTAGGTTAGDGTVTWVEITGQSTYNWSAPHATLVTCLTTGWATGAGDIVYIDIDHTEGRTTDSGNVKNNWTCAIPNNMSLICSDDRTNAPPQTLGVMGTTNGWFGDKVAAQNTSLNGGVKAYVYGLTLWTGGNGSRTLGFGNTNGGDFVGEKVTLYQGNAYGQALAIGAATGATDKSFVRLIDCTISFAHQNDYVSYMGHGEIVNVSIIGTQTLVIFAPGRASVTFDGCDFVGLTGQLIGNSQSNEHYVTLRNCQLASGMVVAGTMSPTSRANGWVLLLNCAYGDIHYQFAYYDPLGALIVDTGIYANDGAKYDGTNKCSWKIVTTANASEQAPFRTPWFGKYHALTAAITPYVEILRDGSTTKLKNNEIWAEFSYQDNSGSPKSTNVNDKCGLLTTPADQDDGVGLAGWTGEGGTAWSGKLSSPSASTPAEIGHLLARVIVGKASTTVYADPTVRT